MKGSAPAVQDSAPIGPQHAVRAWLRVRRAGPVPDVIEDLKPRRSNRLARSYVFRLAGGDCYGNAIVAKLSRAAASEAFLHSRILEPLSVGVPRLVGITDEPAVDDMQWLFLEDVGDEWWDSRTDTTAAKWLAHVHASSIENVPVRLLPTRDLGMHLRQFGRAQRELDVFAHGERPLDQRIFLARLARVFGEVCDVLVDRQHLLARVPNAIVHGDLVAKNARVQWRDGTPTFLALDWEHAGFGTPVVDLWWLAYSPAAADVYFSAIQEQWPGVARSEFSSIVQLGALLRLMTSAVWEVPSLQYPSAARPIRRLRNYAVGISGAVRNLECNAISTHPYHVRSAR